MQFFRRRRNSLRILDDFLACEEKRWRKLFIFVTKNMHRQPYKAVSARQQALQQLVAYISTLDATNPEKPPVFSPILASELTLRGSFHDRNRCLKTLHSVKIEGPHDHPANDMEVKAKPECRIAPQFRDIYARRGKI